MEFKTGEFTSFNDGWYYATNKVSLSFCVALHINKRKRCVLCRIKMMLSLLIIKHLSHQALAPEMPLISLSSSIDFKFFLLFFFKPFVSVNLISFLSLCPYSPLLLWTQGHFFNICL